MRPPFGDIEGIKAKAKGSVSDGFATIKRWWVQKYKLPITHELFSEQSLAELTQELYEDLYHERNSLLDQIDGGQGTRFLETRLSEVNKILGEDHWVGDALVDKWERELAEGKVPDLEEGLDGNA